MKSNLQATLPEARRQVFARRYPRLASERAVAKKRGGGESKQEDLPAS